MEIACTSDLHGRHKQWYKRLSKEDRDNFDASDIIVVAGDVTNIGEVNRAKEFLRWLDEQKAPNKIFIAGNHDFCFDTSYRAYTEMGKRGHLDKEIHNSEEYILDLLKPYESVTYLNDSGCEIGGINFWGSPVTKWFHDWAFNREEGQDIKQTWDKIPDTTDVLITHGPPKGILSDVGNFVTGKFEDAGDSELLKAVYRVRPKVHVFGHIHDMYGTQESDGMVFVNASSLDDAYNPIHPPIFIEA